MTVDHELFGDRLPSYLTRFVGRRGELAELRKMCLVSRVVTVCGVGGLGKTRLAIELARSLRDEPGLMPRFDEVCWVPLVAVSDPDEVGSAIASGLGLSVPSSPQALLAVVNRLRGRRSLLVVDNCEQVVAGCVEAFATLRSSGIDVTVVATSRIPLGPPDEVVYTVPPMTDDALELFADRVRAVAPTYAITPLNLEPIGEICARLAGLPLAVELAAMWTRVISPSDMLGRLAETAHQAPATGLVEERHGDLDRVLAGTWAWLGERDREVATALGVFAGGFTRDAAEQVAGADLGSLATLTERGIIQRLPDASGGTRYHLHELVRAYAVERLDAARPAILEELRARHFDYFLGVAESLYTPASTQLEPQSGGPIAADSANIDAALHWALGREDAVRALRIIDALHAMHPYSQPRRRDRITQLSQVLALPGTRQAAGVDLGNALQRQAFNFLVDDRPQAIQLFLAARETFAAAQDRAGESIALRTLGYVAYTGRDLVTAAEYTRASREVAGRIDDELGEAWNLLNDGAFADVRDDPDRAVELFAASRRIFRRHHAPFGQYRSFFLQAECLRRARRWRPTLDAYRSAYDLAAAERFTSEGGDLLEGLGCVAAAFDEGPGAARLAGAAAMWRAVYDEQSRIYWPSGTDDVARARRHLGDDTWEQLVAEGYGLTTARAERLAYEVLDRLTVVLDRAEAELTGRELEVLRLVAEGLSSSDIADRLVLSPRTVHAHLRSIFIKLGVTTRTAAAHEAARLHVV